MWSLTMSPAFATTLAHQQAMEAVGSARRAHRARLAADVPEPQGRPKRSTRRGPRHRWTRVLVGRAAS
jgi:hypothetical protein